VTSKKLLSLWLFLTSVRCFVINYIRIGVARGETIRYQLSKKSYPEKPLKKQGALLRAALIPLNLYGLKTFLNLVYTKVYSYKKRLL